jgi:hypothetical protein
MFFLKTKNYKKMETEKKESEPIDTGYTPEQIFNDVLQSLTNNIVINSIYI